jgi:hypothetical protein
MTTKKIKGGKSKGSGATLFGTNIAFPSYTINSILTCASALIGNDTGRS